MLFFLTLASFYVVFSYVYFDLSNHSICLLKAFLCQNCFSSRFLEGKSEVS